VKTPETKAKAALLGAATRKARGTMGPKAKLSVKGTLDVPATPPVVTPSPETAPAAQPLAVAPVATQPAVAQPAPQPAAVPPVVNGAH
jgi:hypothetical protein